MGGLDHATTETAALGGRPPVDRARRRFLGRLGVATLVTGGVAAGAPAGAPAGAQEREGARDPRPGEPVVPDLSGDASDALADAIERVAQAGGGVVRLPAGTVELDRPVVLPSNVTLQGVSATATVLAGAGIEHEPGVEGTSIERLTVDGGVVGIRYSASEAGALGARYCTVRDVRVRRTVGAGIELDQGAYEHFVIDSVFLDDVGTDGIDLAATAPCRSVFLSQVAIEGIGAGEGTASVERPPHGLRLAGRCQGTQLRIGPVRAGQVGIGFERGSDHTVLSNVSITTEGDGEAFAGLDGAAVEVGPNEVERT